MNGEQHAPVHRMRIGQLLRADQAGDPRKVRAILEWVGRQEASARGLTILGVLEEPTISENSDFTEQFWEDVPTDYTHRADMTFQVDGPVVFTS